MANSAKYLERGGKEKVVENKNYKPTIINRPSISLRKDLSRKNLSQRERFRQFLKPLNISELKTFSDPPPFNTSTATQNWKLKHNSYTSFFNDRALFNKMMDLLISLTPPHLKNIDHSSLKSVLSRQHAEEEANKFVVRGNEFGELPKMPREKGTRGMKEDDLVSTVRGGMLEFESDKSHNQRLQEDKDFGSGSDVLNHNSGDGNTGVDMGSVSDMVDESLTTETAELGGSLSKSNNDDTANSSIPEFCAELFGVSSSSFSSSPSPSSLQFQEYIYKLCHTTYHYKNSSSLNGIIPDILLLTHNLNNESYKHLRSVHTYNYLIRYFGYKKNQSTFARELLLVMTRDGHKPNIDTINNLLKTCQIHSHIRSNTNTYQSIIKYLKLTRLFQVDLNLTTFTRIYDCIGNIFLRETFLNKIQSIELPIPRSLLLRIIDDFSSTTKDTNELVEFIEKDLARPDWFTESALASKVVYHRGLQVQNADDLVNLYTFITSKISKIDNHILKSLFESLNKNDKLQHKFYSMMVVYLKHDVDINGNIKLYQYLIKQFFEEFESLSIDQYSFILRGLFHEITTKLNLPLEITKYDNNKYSVGENFAIIRRILDQNHLIKFEAIANYLKLPSLYEELNPEQVSNWNDFCEKVKTQQFESLPITDIFKLLNFPHDENVPNEIPETSLLEFQNIAKSKAYASQIRHKLQRSEEDIDEFTLKEMRRRKIIEEDTSTNF